MIFVYCKFRAIFKIYLRPLAFSAPLQNAGNATDSLTVVLRSKIEQISGKAYSQTPLGTLANYMYTNNKAR